MCMEVVRESDPTARREYRCIWCGEKIPKGEKHHQQVGTVYGDFQDNRYHAECWGAAVDDWNSGGDCDFEEASHKRGTCEAS